MNYPVPGSRLPARAAMGSIQKCVNRPSRDRRFVMSDAQNRIVRLWKQYKKSGTQNVRNQLIENYLPLVRSHAERLKAKLPSVVQVDDLTTAGVLGLMDAIEQFDIDRGVKFETFSAIRIRGA